MATAGEKLLSSLRKTKSRSALYQTPMDYFEGDEREAFQFLRDFVDEHNAWPTPPTFQRETDITLVRTREPLTFYLDDARKRSLFHMLHTPFGEIRDNLHDKNPDEVIRIMRDCVNAAGAMQARGNGVIRLDESMRMLEEDFDLARANRGQLRGIPTGYAFLDEATEGFQNANMYSFVARTGVGKTSKLLAMAKAARAAGNSVLFLSMEMGVIQIARRFFGIETGYDPRLMRSARFTSQVEREMRGQLTEMQDDEGPPFFWLAGDFKKTVPALKAAAYETQADIIFADASYLLKPEDRTGKNARHELLNDVQEELAAITTSMNRPLVQSIQFNRQAIKPKRGEQEDDQTRRNPLAHLSLEKIGGTDTVGQISSVVCGLAEGEGANFHTERFCGILKGREGEQGWYCYNYLWRPVNLSQKYTDEHFYAQHAQGGGQAPDMSYMDAAL